jgi:hypothetical protein
MMPIFADEVCQGSGIPFDNNGFAPNFGDAQPEDSDLLDLVDKS